MKIQIFKKKNVLFHRFPFDGKGNVLAHAFYPTDQGSLGGDIHFDEDEDWTLESSNNGM